MNFDDIYFNINETDTLYLKHYKSDNNNNNYPILMIHGAIENGKIFYSNSHKGFAPFLCSQGFDVFVADLRGHGNSTPKIDKNSKYGQFEHLTEDVPAFIAKVFEISQKKKLNIIAHSWGGVLTNAFLIRNPKMIKKINKMAFFGSKRRIKGFNFEKVVKIYIMWGIVCGIYSKFYKYLPAVKLKIGSDNDTYRYYTECSKWVKNDQWIDEVDNFNYKKNLKNLKMPQTKHIAGKNDLALGHPNDVRRFMDEFHPENQEFVLLSKENGNLCDYDHISMLTHPNCQKDHFIEIANWLKQ